MDKFYVGHIMLGIQIISVLCLISFLFTVIFYVPQKHNSRTIILKAVLFFIVYTQFIFLIYSSKYYLDIKFLTYTEAVIFYLTMPFMYMYYKNILYNKPLLRGNNGKHLLASIPGLIYFIFYNMQDKMLQEKMLLIKNADLLNDDLLMGIGISIQIIYLIMSIRLLLNFEKKNDKKITKETRTLIHIQK